MKRLTAMAAGIGLLCAAVLWWLTAPIALEAATLERIAAHEPNIANGENVFWASGCASCHAAPDASDEAKLILSGGYALETEFGRFVAPNISTDAEEGIGTWSLEDFANAMRRGISPAGQHYYPAFPYASYAKMTDEDVADLFAFMKTLPASQEPSKVSDLGFPFNIRRGVGLWKRLYLNEEPIVVASASTSDDQWMRGRYLVEGLGHCGECHTPRDFAGGLDVTQWLSGAPNPSGRGRIPGITNSDRHLGSWSAGDIAYSLETGFTPEFDSLGGTMADVVFSYSNVRSDDREAIAVYLKSIQ